MSDPHLPFLRAVAADPTDDLPRLVYADFLEETGDPVHVARAHFIRAQIALETLTPRSPEARQAEAMCARLKDMFLGDWSWELPEELRQRRAAVWRRGFVDEIVAHMTAGDPRTDHVTRSWFDTVPVRAVRFSTFSYHDLGGWERRFDWRRVDKLHIGPDCHHLARDMEADHGVLRGLVSDVGFTSLRMLDLSGNLIRDAWVVRFVSLLPDSTFASTLETLDFSNCQWITDAGANALATAHSLDKLRSLRLRGVPLSAASVAMLRRRFGDGLIV